MVVLSEAEALFQRRIWNSASNEDLLKTILFRVRVVKALTNKSPVLTFGFWWGSLCAYSVRGRVRGQLTSVQVNTSYVQRESNSPTEYFFSSIVRSSTYFDLLKERRSPTIVQ